MSEEEAIEAGASAAEHTQWQSQDELLARLPAALVQAFKQTELEFYKHCKVVHRPYTATLTCDWLEEGGKRKETRRLKCPTGMDSRLGLLTAVTCEVQLVSTLCVHITGATP